MVSKLALTSKVSPLAFGLVPKSEQGQLRIVQSEDDVVDLILCLGKGTCLVKVDLKHIYHHL